ncbi:glycosyltransferase [Frateuria aurantia]|uniref:Glycosyltransferase n=1 Tax=Frateuria aurantia (strain ATCC 33424 / DSM 6220 / KCTC 2777 / LMG 1558 / NBRC 3245 / NCIMB 13370) TaxID=767434 RepID=H8L6K3_FRAAD|nr:glycosyltransferase [Frateuria aurantia]AFC85995.1 glycosyltransferase [Frateuria aurantia DSM 6220]
MAESRPRLLVLASTYPRWRDDHEPGFVHALCSRLVDDFEIVVGTPHAAGAAREEIMDGVHVFRYRYAPEVWQTLVHGGGIVANLRRHGWKLALVPGFLLAQCWQAARLRRRFQPALIHAHWLFPQGLAAALAAPAAYAVTSHGGDLYGLRGAIFRLVKARVAQKARALAVVSRAMRAPMQALAGPAGRIGVLPMGVDLAGRFHPDPALPRRGLLFVGRLVEKKGLDVLLRALPAVLRQRPGLDLTVVGEGPMRGPWQALTTSLGLAGRVHFLGARRSDELPEFYRAAEVFVAPFVRAASGDQEGLGLVLVEALGCGCPVVVSDLPACADVHQGMEGVLTVPPGDPEALAANLILALQIRERLQTAVLAAQPLLRARFGWDAVASRYAEWLRRAMAVPAAVTEPDLHD